MNAPQTPGVSLTVTLVVCGPTFTMTALCPLAETTTRYWVSALPPLSLGADQLTVADLTPATAATPRGAEASSPGR